MKEQVKDDDILGRWYVRYGFGALMLLISFSMFTGEAKDPWPAAILFGIIALICMKELALWAIGVGFCIWIGSMLVGALAAIPVSVAIIIGALVIANK